MGHIVSPEGVRTDPEKSEKVANWPTPSSKREVQQFLGLANYYRRFVKDFAVIAKLLHRLTEKTARFEWGDECQRSFEELRGRLVTAPILLLQTSHSNSFWIRMPVTSALVLFCHRYGKMEVSELSLMPVEY